jgi:[ribosomal protein S5]-alanine N-acetyltransferase
LIGNGGLRMQNAYARIADLGYELDQNYWGRGYATEAARALLEFGFHELRLHRIWANCIEENVASAHVLEKIGMTREGCLRESEWMKNRWWNTPLYAILDHEWHTLQK